MLWQRCVDPAKPLIGELYCGAVYSIPMEADRWMEQNTEGMEYKKSIGAGGITDRSRGAGDCWLT